MCARSSSAAALLFLAGKGTQVWGKSGAIYDGDWRAGLRHGFGTLSTKEGDVHMKKYAGGWKNDMRHVRPTVVCMSRELIVVMCTYLLQGYGTNFYGPEEYYEGEWYADKRSGWGRMYYADGSVYAGALQISLAFSLLSSSIGCLSLLTIMQPMATATRARGVTT